jgi:hypothetical protein
MAQRILSLGFYLFRTLLFSLSGVLYFLLGLAFWWIFFDPGQQTPEAAYFTLVLGLFGTAVAFLVALSVAARANHACNYPLLARLPSRVEHLAAVLLASFAFSLILQLMVTILATIRGPELPLGRLFEIPPLWLAANILAIVLALHASDLVAFGWSRVYVFGLLAVFLFGRGIGANGDSWLADRFTQLSGWLFRQGFNTVAEVAANLARWLADNGGSALGRFFGLVFWPFDAINDAVIAGGFTASQSLAPAVLLLYATFLFMLAADLFASKDLQLIE